MELVQYNGTTLAYIGDAYLSLKVRELLVSYGWQKPKILQEKSVAWVSAKAQANFLKQFMELAILSEDEMIIVKRGRNARMNSMAKNADVMTYRLATGLEALFGYLYLTNQQERLDFMWNTMKELGENA